MNKERAKELQEFCNTVAERFSNKTRQGNVNNETLGADDVVCIFGNAINGWNGTANPMSDDNDDGIHELTLNLAPGVIEYKAANIQLLDLPGIIEGAAQGKGRGRQVIAVARLVNFKFSKFQIQ